ncbi:MAG: M48 family metalloprotease [Burkholderiales bacterium]|nr:M48 family metalloprotease [Burkholderiales bacterium]
MLARIAFVLIGMQAVQVCAETIFDVEKVLAGVPPVVAQGATIALQDGQVIHRVKIENLRALLEVHKRIGEVSKLQATLAIAIHREANAFAIPLPGRNLILVTTGMMDVIGTDSGMIAALLGHEYAHHYMKHALQRALQLPEFVYGAIAIGNDVGREVGSRLVAARAANAAFGLMHASFSRQQEAEADKVGTELMSDAKYDPEGAIRFFSAMLKLYGAKPTGYSDSHPGSEERLAKAAPTVLNQSYDSIAITLKEQKNWRSLGRIVDQWLKASPDSARAWYYKGIVLKVAKRTGALAAFEKSVAYDPNFYPGRLALCIELYVAGRERDSIVCAEYIPKNELFNEYVASTFKHPVYVGGIHPQRVITAQDVKVVERLMAQDR